jgi:HEAT repeat protein
MGSFSEILADIKRDCGLEHIPYDKVSAMARLCGPAEVDRLICELEALDDADLEDDAGDGIDEYWRLRTAYSQALAEVGEPAVEPLLRALGSENPQTRAFVARALGFMGAKRAFDPICALLAQEGDVELRMSLMEALGGLGDQRAVAVLLPYLTPAEQANRAWIVRVAAKALGGLGTESAITPLAEVLASDRDWLARLGAAEGLRKIQHPLAAETLRRALADADARVRVEAAAGLRSSGYVGEG